MNKWIMILLVGFGSIWAQDSETANPLEDEAVPAAAAEGQEAPAPSDGGAEETISPDAGAEEAFPGSPAGMDSSQAETAEMPETAPVDSGSQAVEQNPQDSSAQEEETPEAQPAMVPEEKAAPAPAAQPAPAEEEKPAAVQAPPQEKTAADDGMKEEESAGDKDKEEGEGFKFSPGLSFGTMTRNGQTWTRFSFRPDISIGKLGVALDLEFFMNERQEFDSYGWRFDSFDNGMESIFRKIYYVRWAHPGDKLYLKAGSLDGISLGYGLIMNGYGNTALYPDKKLLGFHGQVNGIGPMGINLELMVNSFREVQMGDGVVGARASFAPLGKMPLPLLNKLRLGATLVSDLNQLSGLPDRDGDNCPDLTGLDIDEDDANVCLGGPPLNDTVNTYDPNATTRESLELQRDLDDQISKPLKDRVRDGDQFSLVSADVGLPIISLPLLSLEVYSEIAFQMYQNSDDFFDGGYGMILPGARSKIGPVSASLEFRTFKMPFYPGHFNSFYEAERAELYGNSLMTKEQKYWADTLSGMSKGIFGSAGVDLKGLATVGGSYKMMFPDEGDNVQGYSGQIALGESIASLIPKIASGSIFWVKERVGEDLNSDGDPGSSDGFFETSIYTYFGYAVGVQMGSNMVITVKNISFFVREEDGSLDKQNTLAMETAITF